uniref:Uncharacterized protein n=1 Tax=Poecilia latipinna TaxID=48699 RepID=A0A3B3VYW0_9TELE
STWEKLSSANILLNIRLVILISHFDYPLQMKPLPWPWIRTALNAALSNHQCRSRPLPKHFGQVKRKKKICSHPLNNFASALQTLLSLPPSLFTSQLI